MIAPTCQNQVPWKNTTMALSSASSRLLGAAISAAHTTTHATITPVSSTCTRLSKGLGLECMPINKVSTRKATVRKPCVARTRLWAGRGWNERCKAGQQAADRHIVQKQGLLWSRIALSWAAEYSINPVLQHQHISIPMHAAQKQKQLHGTTQASAHCTTRDPLSYYTICCMGTHLLCACW